MNPLFTQELQELYNIIENTNGKVTFGEVLYAITKGKQPKDFLEMDNLQIINLIRETQFNETEY